MDEYKIRYFDDIVDVDDYIEKNGKFLSNSEIVDILNELSNDNKQLKEKIEQLKHKLDAFKPAIFQDTEKGTIMLYARDY